MNQHLALDRTPAEPFIPPRIIRNASLQTFLTITKLDIPQSLNSVGYPMLIDAGIDETGKDEGGVRLLAYYTPRYAQTPDKGAVILLHGWEGCSHSHYSLVTMLDLNKAGYDVFRLNVRDHGPNIHVQPQSLNPGVFLGTLLDEVITAIIQCANMVQPSPVYVVGFSLGGNYALRTAIRHAERPIPNLRKVIAVNPAINPLLATRRVDQNPALRRNFRKPWIEQLVNKQRLYPELYDFGPAMKMDSLIDMTNWLVRYVGAFDNAEEYFHAYSVLGSATRDLAIPTQIITSLDDMIVAVSDIYGLWPNPNLKVDIHEYGGHVGYMKGLPPRRVAGEMILSRLETA